MVEEPDHEFLFEMFVTSGHFPDSEKFENMNPFLRVWLYESWVAKQKREMERDRRLAILIGSFHNPEAAQKMIKRDHPDVKATDDDQVAQAIHEQILREETGGRKRRRRRKVVR